MFWAHSSSMKFTAFMSNHCVYSGISNSAASSCSKEEEAELLLEESSLAFFLLNIPPLF